MKPICEIDSDGDKHWYLDGKRHREDGPAIEFKDGSKEWWINGDLHREDGPGSQGNQAIGKADCIGGCPLC